MFFATCLLVVTCAYANADDGHWPPPLPPRFCTTADLGEKTRFAIKLPSAIIPRDPPYIVVPIPDNPQCQRGVSGLHASVCDSDVAPSAQFLDSHRLLVTRNGSTLKIAEATVTVFCNP